MASLVGKLGGGGVVGGMAAKAGLFKPTNILAAATEAISSKAKQQVDATKASVVGGVGGKINWEAYNWPSKLEIFSIIHFDLVELKEKRDAAVFQMVLWCYRWWLYTMLICAINFMDCIILTVVAGPAYQGVNVLFNVIWWLIWAALGMATVYKAYHGVAEGSVKSKIMAKGLSVASAILVLIHIFANFGNVNGISGLNGSHFKSAVDQGVDDSAITYWETVTAAESLLWLGNGVWFGWVMLRIFKGPSVKNEAVALPK